MKYAKEHFVDMKLEKNTVGFSMNKEVKQIQEDFE